MRVGVIGFGFSGLMVAANLVREATAPLALYMIATDLSGKGLAYGTINTEHLLNVRAGNMSAFADVPTHFVQWLESDAGKYAAAAQKITSALGATDFAPRALYGDYLSAIWQQTQELAAEKKIEIKLVVTRASRVMPGKPLSVLTERGDAIAVDRVVLATGNDSRSALRELDAGWVIQNPWGSGALDKAVKSDGPIVLLGTGLTAVDMVLSLKRAAYSGSIVALSRRGLLPQPHTAVSVSEYVWDKEVLLTQTSLVGLMRHVARAITEHREKGGDWRAVIDGLRPYTQRLWQKLSTREQQRFFARVLPYWNVHRHRMAPEVARRLAHEIEEGHLRVLSSRKMEATMEDGKAKLTFTTSHGGAPQVIYPSAIINCIGPELRLPQTAHNLLKQLLADRLAEVPLCGVGLSTDPQYRVLGEAYPALYATGSLMTGQFLESTAVPELRVQAAAIARSICK
jgi:uncharacterized NAD(P)/FAD-binding protein YdhS